MDNLHTASFSRSWQTAVVDSTAGGHQYEGVEKEFHCGESNPELSRSNEMKGDNVDRYTTMDLKNIHYSSICRSQATIVLTDAKLWSNLNHSV